MGKKAWICLCLALLLTGCAGKEPAADGNAGNAAPPAVKTADTAEQGGDLHAEQVAAAARPLTEEEILTAYERAVDIYSWFELYPLASTGETVTDDDGTVYRRVNYPGVETMSDLRTCLRSVFSEAVTDRLLSADGSMPHYREIDGALYVAGQGRSQNAWKGGINAQIQQTGEASYSVNVTVELLDDDGSSVTGLESWAFPYAFEGGRWVFTDFGLIY